MTTTMRNTTPTHSTKSLLLLLCFINLFSVSAQEQWTLEACVNYALENNISVQQSKNALLSNNQDIIAAKGNFLPSLGVGASQRLNLGNVEVFDGQFLDRTFHSSNIGLNVSQTIFNGFRNTNIYKQSLINKEANEEEIKRIRDNVALNVVNSYLNVMLNKENLSIAETQYKFSIEQLERVKELVAAGIQPRANLFDAEAALASDEQRLTVADNSYNLALLALTQRTNSDGCFAAAVVADVVNCCVFPGGCCCRRNRILQRPLAWQPMVEQCAERPFEFPKDRSRLQLQLQ